MFNGIVLWFIDGDLGRRVYLNTHTAYTKSQINKDELDLATWLTSMGWPCTMVEETTKSMNIFRGLQFKDMESITAFVLRWG
jgi:hypothetical protein